MIRLRVAAAVLALGAGAGLLGAPPALADNPSEACGPDNLVTILYTHPTLGWTKPITRTTFTHGGCASAWATGRMTAAAIAKQCSEVLSRFFPFSPYGYAVENQGDCIRVMGGLSRGELDPGPVDPFPY